MRAFNQARGTRAVGSGHAHLTSFSVSGRRPDVDTPYVFFEILGGGWGATPAGDGLEATFGLMANCLDVPIEALDEAIGGVAELPEVLESLTSDEVRQALADLPDTFRVRSPSPRALRAGRAGPRVPRRCRFLVNRLLNPSASQSITVVLNWAAALSRWPA